MEVSVLSLTEIYGFIPKTFLQGKIYLLPESENFFFIMLMEKMVILLVIMIKLKEMRTKYCFINLFENKKIISCNFKKIDKLDFYF